MQKYVIFNLNSLEGVQAGHLKTLDTLYYVDHTRDKDAGTRVSWTDFLKEAKRFDTEKEAWEAMHDLYFHYFVSTNLMVCSVFPEGLDRGIVQ